MLGVRNCNRQRIAEYTASEFETYSMFPAIAFILDRVPTITQTNVQHFNPS